MLIYSVQDPGQISHSIGKSNQLAWLTRIRAPYAELASQGKDLLMKISEMFPRKYASGADLNGHAPTLIISHIEKEPMSSQPGKAPELKFVIYFEKAAKGIVLSRTLAEQIAVITKSDDTDQWIGKKVTIYAVPMKVAGKDRIAIRAKSPVSGESTPPLSLQEEEE